MYMILTKEKKMNTKNKQINEANDEWEFGLGIAFRALLGVPNSKKNHGLYNDFISAYCLFKKDQIVRCGDLHRTYLSLQLKKYENTNYEVAQ